MYLVKRIEVALRVPSIEKAVAWYERVLGWKGHCQFGSVMHGDIGLNLSRFSEKDVPYSNAYSNFTASIVVDNVDDVYTRVVENGWTPDSAPKNEFWGGRTFTMRDMNGFKLMFVQMVESVALEEVRRHHRKN